LDHRVQMGLTKAERTGDWIVDLIEGAAGGDQANRSWGVQGSHRPIIRQSSAVAIDRVERGQSERVPKWRG
jgi:hypothetical protein